MLNIIEIDVAYRIFLYIFRESKNIKRNSKKILAKYTSKQPHSLLEGVRQENVFQKSTK
jgi:hypothetical protein